MQGVSRRALQMLPCGECYENVYTSRRTNYPSLKGVPPKYPFPFNGLRGIISGISNLACLYSGNLHFPGKVNIFVSGIHAASSP
jgi:hypothetical protein